MVPWLLGEEESLLSDCKFLLDLLFFYLKESLGQ